MIVDEELLDSLPNAFISPNIMNLMTVCADIEEESQEREGYDPARWEGSDTYNGEEDEDDEGNFQVINSDSDKYCKNSWMKVKDEYPGVTGLACNGGSVLSNVDGGDDIDQAAVADMLGATLASKTQESMKEDSDMYIRYVHSSQPLRDYDNAEYFLGSFPTLFWTGRRGHLEQ